MSLRINGFKAGALSAMLALGVTGCKKPYKPMPKEQILPRMEQVVDSFYKEGLQVKDDPKYKLIFKDTIRFRDSYWKDPSNLKGLLNAKANTDKTPVSEWDTDWYHYNDPKYIVSSNQIFTKDNGKAYIAIEEYDRDYVFHLPGRH